MMLTVCEYMQPHSESSKEASESFKEDRVASFPPILMMEGLWKPVIKS